MSLALECQDFPLTLISNQHHKCAEVPFTKSSYYLLSKRDFDSPYQRKFEIDRQRNFGYTHQFMKEKHGQKNQFLRRFPLNKKPMCSGNMNFA